jgi:hypothetical protein
MNAVEIEQAVSDLAQQPFDAKLFPYAFLAAFGNKNTTLERLRSGKANASDLPNGVLERSSIHIAVCSTGAVSATLSALRSSQATFRAKAKFVLATDGQTLQAQDIASNETIACDYTDFPNHFGFLLPLAGISTTQEIRNNPVDVRATGRMNKLYVELLRENPKWDSAQRRRDINYFMARMIFCFYAESTGIFEGSNQFIKTIEQLSKSNAVSTNTHEVLSEIFRALRIKHDQRRQAQPHLPAWTDKFPYVGGDLFSENIDVPHFNKTALTYLMHAGSLDWKQINPDIFGSMIQAVAHDDERGNLGLHYTSVPNILKVLGPLFLDDLRAQLNAAGNNKVKLLKLRKRIALIRVFDPACGSGNFLLIAYKEMRAIESEINNRCGQHNRLSDIPLTNFKGIELRDFSAQIARLVMTIAKFQCDAMYLGTKIAVTEFSLLEKSNWIVCGNALRIDWLSICPPSCKDIKLTADNLSETSWARPKIKFQNNVCNVETYICGNPPYLGNQFQSEKQKSDLAIVFDNRLDGWKYLDYAAGWLMKAADYSLKGSATSAFVMTNSVCQGQQVPILWPKIFATGNLIDFAYTSFNWSNLASHNAVVSVIIVGISNIARKKKRLYTCDDKNLVSQHLCDNINPYLVDGANLIVEGRRDPPIGLAPMLFGSMPRDGGHLIVSYQAKITESRNDKIFQKYLRCFVGAEDFIQGKLRYCLWIEQNQLGDAVLSPAIAARLDAVKAMRLASKANSTRDYAASPYRFVQIQDSPKQSALIVPRCSSQHRSYLPVGLLDATTIIADSAFALYDAPLWNMALIASRLHLVWISAVCGKLKTDFRYSNTLGWNTFPIQLPLTEQNKMDMTTCAQNILLAREAHFPATIADLYEPGKMPENLRLAHDHNDEVIEHMYIGGRFKNDTQRLEKLFDLYTKMTTNH